MRLKTALANKEATDLEMKKYKEQIQSLFKKFPMGYTPQEQKVKNA